MNKDVLTGRAIEIVGAIGLIASLVFVAYEIRQNTLAARAAAIQEIGIATAEMWGEIARNPNSLRVLQRSDIPVSDWTADDWVLQMAQMVAWSRLSETLYRQVEEGLLPQSSLEYLGYEDTKRWRQHPGIYCLWEYRLKTFVSAEFAAFVESGPEPEKVDCEAFPNFPFKTPRYVGERPQASTYSDKMQPNKALQPTLDPASRLADAKRLAGSRGG